VPAIRAIPEAAARPRGVASTRLDTGISWVACPPRCCRAGGVRNIGPIVADSNAYRWMPPESLHDAGLHWSFKIVILQSRERTGRFPGPTCRFASACYFPCHHSACAANRNGRDNRDRFLHLIPPYFTKPAVLERDAAKASFLGHDCHLRRGFGEMSIEIALAAEARRQAPFPHPKAKCQSNGTGLSSDSSPVPYVEPS
jgi:hypothetical protein